ncbi:hypothetical protein CERZMDRAFT_104582 [Cercospora zeae-maydis SCOH1-5]|uniref:Uncharacterized protein n=1 Tax=Cercospora zeae-maydis SCOH1-5 TaxID=717836 RepID=A0A6A6FV28_9PEZI|nr:hypothetical protein CERZMDRAFT_104582 [Cercospora zeae-maydis SCOH1-5]
MQTTYADSEGTAYPGVPTSPDNLAHRLFSEDIRNDDSGYYGLHLGHQEPRQAKNQYGQRSLDGVPRPRACSSNTRHGQTYATSLHMDHGENSTEGVAHGYNTFQTNGRRDPTDDQQCFAEEQQLLSSNELSECDQDLEAASDAEIEDEAFRRDILEAAEARCFSDDPLQYMPLVPMVSSVQDLEDLPGAVNVEQLLARKQSQGCFQDRWQVDKESAMLLASIARDIKDYRVGGMRFHLPVPLRHCRIEPPVLQSDPDTDLRRLRDRNEIKITSEGMMPFHLDVDKGESLDWGAEDLALPAHIRKQLESEKLPVDAETMAFMKEVLGGTQQSLGDLLRRECGRKITPTASPTLLPLSPSMSPARIPPEIANVTLTSTPEDPTVREAAELHARVITRDEQEAKASMKAGMDEVQSFLVHEADLSVTPPRKKTRTLQSLKVSSPLLPQTSSEVSEPPAKRVKTVSFSDELQSVIGSIPPHEDWTDPELGAQKATATLTQMLGPLVEHGIEQLEKEQLDEFDTIARVPVPEVPPIIPAAPWEDAGSSDGLLKQIGEEFSKPKRTWRGATKLEETLSWVPFSSHLAQIKPEGEFDDGSCARYLQDLHLDDELEVHRLTWKPEGLRLLDDEEEDSDHELHRTLWSSDEEDLIPFGMHETTNSHPRSVPGPTLNKLTATATGYTPFHDSHPDPADQKKSTRATMSAANVGYAERTRSKFFLSAAPRRRRSRQHVPQDSSGAEESPINENLAQRKAKLDKAVAAKFASVNTSSNTKNNAGHGVEKSVAENQKLPRTKPPNVMEHFGQFLMLQGQPNVPPTTEVEVAAPEGPGGDANSKAPDLVDATENSNEPAPENPQQSALDVPAPKLIRADERFCIAVSSSVMNNRHMIRKLEKLIPALEVVIRDSDDREREADITVSASTGVIFTSLQKLKQKPLPGQKAFFGIREQVAMAAARYERLVVLVSEGKQGSGSVDSELSGLDRQDADALCEFTGDCELLDAGVHVCYVPGGDEQLMHWLAGTIARYGDPSILVQEETYWERFLRKAGLNAPAAQVILQQLQVSAGSTDDAPFHGRGGLSGLPAFVCMSEEDRVRHFARVLGGEGMLRRASKAIDGRWVSANNVMV